MNIQHPTQASDNFATRLPDDFVSLDETNALTASTCCGGPAKTHASACCALDEQKKAEGAAGCGCGTAQPAGTTTRRAATTCCG